MNARVPIISGLRSVERLVEGTPVTDGAGVRISRMLAQDLQRRLDPFLMLDVFRSDDPSDYLAGFPDHPHRGFETVTYMIAGRMRHRDNAGHQGLLETGGVQWMTAGRGIIHSEMPEQEQGLMEGFQLWLNLPTADKMVAPHYRDIQAGEIPEFVTAEGVTVRVIAGECRGQRGAIVRPVTDPLYLDLHFPAGGSYRGTEADSQVPYLKTVLGFLGMTDVHFIYAEGLNMGAEAAECGFAQAEADLAAALA